MFNSLYSSNYTGAEAVLDANQTRTTITGLVNGTNYQFAIKAKASGEYSNFDYATATPNSSIGIDELNNNNYLYLYTNPTIGVLYTNIESIDNCAVRSIDGSIVHSSIEGMTISIETNTPGVYFITIESDEMLYNSKVILK